MRHFRCDASHITSMNFYLLATSAWGVRKGLYSRQRFRAMINHFVQCFETSCNNIFSSKEISRKKKKSIYNAYKSYKYGLKLFLDYDLTNDCLLLLEGLIHIDKGRETFLKSGRKICCYMNEKLM